MKTPSLFARITKIDEAKRLVHTRVVHEVADKADEIFDYAASRPHFEDWSKGQHEASGGKSYGNVRAMHGKIAAGIFAEPLAFNDADKAIDGVIKVTDDQEWSKCLDGTYTGVSIGGAYVGDKRAEKIDGRDIKRYTAKPTEVSLVDVPCVPTAKFFEVIKADGKIEKVAFKEPPIEVTGSDEEVRAFGKLLNDSKLALGDAIKILQAHTEKKPIPPTKSQAEQDFEAAARYVDLKKKLDDPELLFADFVKIAEAELGAEAFAKIKGGDIAATKTAILEKIKISGANMDRLQAIHDHATSMGAGCGADKTTTPDLTKGGDVAKQLADAMDRITKLEKQPTPHAVTLRVVQRGENVDKKTADALSAVPYEKLVKFPDGQVDWAASERELQKSGAAA
jgi:hypothetical protein